MTADETRVVLYSRAGCHLCADAEVLVAEVCQELGAAWTVVDVDEPGRQALAERYGEWVPVVLVDGVQQGYWHIDAARLRRVLTGVSSGIGPQAG